MRRVVVIAAALAAMLVLIPAANAARVSTLRSGDDAFVGGTDLVCAVARAHGELAVDCFRASGKGLVANSYSVGLASGGAAVLQHVNARGKVKIVRKLQAVARAARSIQLANGDGFKVAGSDLACVVVGKAVTCFRYNGKGSVPGSYGFVLTDSYAMLTRYDAKGKASSVVTKLQGS